MKNKNLNVELTLDHHFLPIQLNSLNKTDNEHCQNLLHRAERKNQL